MAASARIATRHDYLVNQEIIENRLKEQFVNIFCAVPDNLKLPKINWTIFPNEFLDIGQRIISIREYFYADKPTIRREVFEEFINDFRTTYITLVDMAHSAGFPKTIDKGLEQAYCGIVDLVPNALEDNNTGED